MLRLTAGRSRGCIGGQGRVLRSGPLRWAKKPAGQESKAHIIQAEEGSREAGCGPRIQWRYGRMAEAVTRGQRDTG